MSQLFCFCVFELQTYLTMNGRSPRGTCAKTVKRAVRSNEQFVILTSKNYTGLVSFTCLALVDRAFRMPHCQYYSWHIYFSVLRVEVSFDETHNFYFITRSRRAGSSVQKVGRFHNANFNGTLPFHRCTPVMKGMLTTTLHEKQNFFVPDAHGPTLTSAVMFGLRCSTPTLWINWGLAAEALVHISLIKGVSLGNLLVVFRWPSLNF